VLAVDGYPVWPCCWCLGDTDTDAHNNCQVTSIYLVSHSWCQFTDGGQHIMSMIDPKCSSPMIDGSGSRSSRDSSMATVERGGKRWWRGTV
jgi:hypothetical protein